MTEKDPKPSWVPGTLAVMLTLMAAAAALVPYWLKIPSDNLTLITQAQTTLWAGWLLMLGYYFGSTANTRKKDDTINTLAQTAQTAGNALGSSESTTVLLPGDQAIVEPKPDGATVITKEPAP